MGIKERILAEKGLICIGMDPEDVKIVDYANEKLDDAAELATKADELMAEMADTIEMLRAFCTDTGADSEAAYTLHLYARYKNQ